MHIPVPLGRVLDTLDSDEGRASFWAESAVEANGHIEFRFSHGLRYIGDGARRTALSRGERGGRTHGRLSLVIATADGEDAIGPFTRSQHESR